MPVPSGKGLLGPASPCCQQAQNPCCQQQAPVPAKPSQVALTQIPYTGFDYGVAGDLMFWSLLVAFAAAAAYMIVYYKGGMSGFLGNLRFTNRAL